MTITHDGRVAEVNQVMRRKNHSDTLDYSDWRETLATEALVYYGRTAVPSYQGAKEGFIGGNYVPVGSTVPVIHRFYIEDCTNLFVWRGERPRTPIADSPETWSREMVEDYIAWKAEVKKNEEEAEMRRLAREAEEKREREEAVKNRPELGKKMVVKSGRKVKPGTIGTVAYISGGRVLLKDDANWKDRKADGVWVEARHLAAR